MATVKCTKSEMSRLQKKLQQLKKYLPTLHLKKMLLQAEVNKAKEEIAQYSKLYKEEILMFETSMKLLSDPSVTYIKNRVSIEKKEIAHENIAGIRVPTLHSLTFKEGRDLSIDTPFWHEDMVQHLRSSKKAYFKWKLSEEKKKILDEELRSVSIRVNLFEKRLIPLAEKDIAAIRVFLGDQALAAVSLAKLAKGKVEKRKLTSREEHAG